MKKKLLSLAILYFISFNLFSQDFLGLTSGNYTGVTGVMLQPASIVDSRYKFDINLFSTDVRYSNNYFLVDRDALLKFNKNNFDDYQTFKAKYLSEANLATGEKAFFNISNRTQLPLSFMANLSKKSAVALTFQSRSMIQGRNITPDLAKLAYNGFYYQPLNNSPIDASGLTINSLSWVEAGLTYGRVLFSNDRHFLKGAFTAKYLGGVASLNMGSQNFNIGVNSDSTINVNASNFSYNHNKNADFDMVFDKNFRPDANAFGLDAGLVYEYRGNLKNFKYIKNDDEKSYLADRRDVNKYIFKLGVSILDAGMFTFEKPANVNSFNANINSWDIRNAHYNSIKEFDTALANRVVANANDPRKYNVYLPGALSVQLDIRFVKGLYLNAMAYRPLKMGSDAGTRFDNYGYYTITPRYERRHFGVYFPYTFSDKNDITNYRENRLGATVRVGPLFIGSSNLGTMAFNKNLKAADVHVGLKIGITYGTPTKASRLFEKKPEVYAVTPAVPIQKVADTIVVKTTAPVPAPKSQLVLDYTKGQVYSVDSMRNGQIIIINNNNYYYGNNPAPTKDSVLTKQMIQVVPADSIRYIRDSIKIVNDKNKRRADSVQKKLTDSISQKKVQLDSLINRLQILRNEMDSVKMVDSSTAFKTKGTLPNAGKQAMAAKTKPVAADTVMKKNVMTVTDTASVYKTETALVTAAPANVKTETIIAEAVIADTAMSIAKTDPSTESVKKKVSSTPDSIKVAAKVQQQQPISQPVAQPQSIIVNVPAQQSQSPSRRNDDLMNRYFRESNQLQNDINRLERRLDEEKRNNRSNIVYPYPVAATTIAPAVTPAKIDTIYIRDTIRIRDTINVMDTLNVRDTINIIKTDTLVKRVTSKPQTIYVPVEKEKIVEAKIDYTKLPAETILFAVGKSAIRAVYSNKLNYLAGILQKNESLKVSITGHTDKSGSPEINELLSFKRANAVKHFFMDKGIAETRLTIEAVASTDPVVTIDTKDDASQNRRVVIKIID
ncbi:MAG: OmpA family protein [Ferruginibacter sp.]